MAVAERTQSEAQRREQILAAARDVFRDSGYESATISQIVERAGVAQGTFYLYFDSKKSIVIELARQPMANMAARLRGVLSGDESFEEMLRQFVRLGFQVGEENPDLCRLMHLSSENSHAARELESDSEVSELAIGMFTQFIGSGEMVEMNPAIAFEMFRIIVTGSMQLAFATDLRPGSIEEIAKATEATVVRAFVTGAS